MKSSKELVFDEIIKDPFISNKEIVERTGLSVSLCNTNIHRLKKMGLVEAVSEDGKRKFVILDNFKSNRSQKNSLYEDMIDVYMEDFVNASTFEDRLRVGREIRLLIDKL